LFAAKCVGEGDWFSEFTGSHQEAGAVSCPLRFWIHSESSRFSVLVLCEKFQRWLADIISRGANVRGEHEMVNYIRMVQWWIFIPKLGVMNLDQVVPEDSGGCGTWGVV
jgi:hypothetical protein